MERVELETQPDAMNESGGAVRHSHRELLGCKYCSSGIHAGAIEGALNSTDLNLTNGHRTSIWLSSCLDLIVREGSLDQWYQLCDGGGRVPPDGELDVHHSGGEGIISVDDPVCLCV